ncbi:MAG: alpha/beta hydrolase family protein [Myxococcales bacterium]|nr:alpha/beta hydrolase family protein [Myxococcales bacterium]
MPPDEWWRRLEPDFAGQSEGFALDWYDRARVQLTAVSDLAIRSGAASAVGALAVSLGLQRSPLRADLDDVDFYARAAEQRNPDLFFAPPPKGVKVTATPASVPSFRPKDGQVMDLRFESPFLPVNPRMHGRWQQNQRNNIAHARYWRHESGPRPTIAAIHGFCADAYWLNTWFFALPLLYRMGYDLLLFTLPFHGPRQHPLSPFSGHGFFARGLAGINEAFAQAVCDFRVLMDHLEAEGVPRLGVTGMSLGGYTAALLAAVEPRLAFSMPNVPVASIPDLLLEWHPLSLAVRAMLAATRQPISTLRRALASCTPLSYPARLPKQRLMIIGGVADRIVPPKHARLLWDHWGRCAIHWFPGSHLIHFDKQDYVTQTAKFFKRIGF